ncbi:MAG: ShlB/FhaC/HecB family hemolysin secretion/activation protein [Alphaproteobacteria bacterium]
MLVVLTCVWTPGGAFAQSSQVPSSADPALVPRQVQPEPAPPPQEGPIIERPREVIQAPPGADQIRFVLTNLEIDGATVYTPAQLRPFYEKLLGTEISLLKIYEIAEAIGAKYGEDGYILSLAAVPAQRIRDGVVRIQVIEGYVDKIVVEGEAIKDSDRIKRIAEKITTFRPLKNDQLERYLLLINDMPGVSARGVLKPSATPGASDLVLVGERKHFDGYTSADNRGTRYVGPYQFQAGGNANGILGLNESTGLRAVVTSQTNELRLIDVSHDEPISDEGTRANAEFQAASVEPGYTLKSQDITSQQYYGAVGANHPLIRSRTKNWSVRGRFDLRNVTVEEFNGASTISEDRIRAIRLATSLDIVDTFLTEPAVSLVGMEVGQGLNVLGARPTGSANLSRPDGHSQFTKLNFEAQRLQTLGGGFNLLLAAIGQYSFSGLLASEEFTFGGAQYGRGFDPAELTGDQGVAAKVELQWGQSLSNSFLRSYQLYAFFDAGAVWQVQPIPDTPWSSSATSTGFGIRANVLENYSGYLEVGKPVTGSVNALGAEDGKKPRVFFATVARF